MSALPANLNVAHASLPQTYENAKTALANCSSIDECKDWSDKAAALASYARQADDATLENYAKRIRMRATRRAGEVLKTFDARPSNNADQKEGGHLLVSQREVAYSAGFSEHQQKQAVRVANVSSEEFESAVEAPKPPSITELARRGINRREPAPEGFKHATKLLGTVRRFSEFCEANDPTVIADGVLDHETPELRAMVSKIDAWLDCFVVNLKG